MSSAELTFAWEAAAGPAGPFSHLRVVSFTGRHDRRGQLVRARNKHADLAFVRDALGRIVEERATIGGESHVVKSRYNDAGHRVRRTTSRGHETEYDVDGRGMLRGLSFSAPARSEGGAAGEEPAFPSWWSTAFQRDVEGAEVERRMPGGVVSRWDRDTLGRGRVLRVTAPWEKGFSRGYKWRSEDQLAAIIDGLTGPLFLEHDARGHLVSAQRPDGAAQYRSPDAVGLVFKSRDRSDRVYEKGGVLRRAGEIEYLHDADGQLVEKRLAGGKAWKYRWDGSGQLAEVTRPDGEKVAFAYDALGRRVQKTAGGTTTTYVWDGNDLVHELRDAAETITWEFEPGTFAPLAKVEGDKRYGVVTDHLGAPVALFDEAGRLAWKAQLDLYGVAQTDVMKTHCPWRFPGQYEDEETGLYYNRFRYYDPEGGRYISQDPIGSAAGLDFYRYVSAPFTQCDPLGLINPWDIVFSQDSIGDTFQHGPWKGHPLSEAIEAAKRLGQLPEGLELTMMKWNDEWVTLSNRTLFVAQEAGLSNVRAKDVGPKGTNQMNKLLDGKLPLPPGEQPRVRGCK